VDHSRILQFLREEEHWLVRNRRAKTVIKDVKYPFSININTWLNLLVVCSYADIARSREIWGLIKTPGVDKKPKQMIDVIHWMQRHPEDIPCPPSGQPADTQYASDWVLNKIPKVLHTYWGGRHLSFIKFMTLYSFKRFNPDWRIKLYVPVHCTPHDVWCKGLENSGAFKGRDYWPFIHKLGIEIIPLDCSVMGLSNNIPEVHKSDFLRWHLMRTEGGVWSDMDVLYCRPMRAFSQNHPLFANMRGFVSIRDNFHKIGFLLSAPENSFFNKVFLTARKSYDRLKYQCAGSDLLDREFPTIEKVNVVGEPMAKMDEDAVYPFKHMAIYYAFFGNGMGYLRPNTVGFHWYAGSCHSKDLVNGINHLNYKSVAVDCTVVQMLRKYFPGGIAL
jgi:hypothetical protein